jgi:hypothetical protein
MSRDARLGRWLSGQARHQFANVRNAWMIENANVAALRPSQANIQSRASFNEASQVGHSIRLTFRGRARKLRASEPALTQQIPENG